MNLKEALDLYEWTLLGELACMVCNKPLGSNDRPSRDAWRVSFDAIIGTDNLPSFILCYSCAGRFYGTANDHRSELAKRGLAHPTPWE